jgi:hypothetical protein
MDAKGECRAIASTKTDQTSGRSGLSGRGGLSGQVRGVDFYLRVSAVGSVFAFIRVNSRLLK